MSSRISSALTAVNNLDEGISKVQTADSWMQKMQDGLGRMKALSVQYNSGTLSEADKINLSVEFKSIQRDLTRISSKYTAAAKFNGDYLLRGGTGEPVTEGDQVKSGDATVQSGPDQGQTTNVSQPNLSSSNNSVVGETVSYNDAGKTEKKSVKWNDLINDITGLKISDSNAVGALSSGIDYLANGRVNAAVEMKTLQSQRDALIKDTAVQNAAESRISGMDMALASVQYSGSGVQDAASVAVIAQGNAMSSSNISALLSSLGGGQ
jgi:flagellin